MTYLRFVGDLPVWIGLILSAIVCVLAWRYYRRESFNLPGHLVWLLPLLRALAFFLGIMILTGPILHHQKTIGEPGQIKIYVDGSQSMGMTDSHMSTARKILAVQNLGWVPDSTAIRSLVDVTDELSNVRTNLLESLKSNPEEIDLDSVRNKFVEGLKRVQSRLPDLETLDPEYQNAQGKSLRDQLAQRAIAPAESLQISENKDSVIGQLHLIAQSTFEVEQTINDAFEVGFENSIESADESVRMAINRFDKTTRWERAKLGLIGDSEDDSIFAQLKKTNHVEVISLMGSDFSKLADSQNPDGSAVEFPDVPAGSLTDLGSQFSSSQNNSLGSGATEDSAKRQTAIVLITDGQHNSGPSPIQMARVLGGQGVQFYPIALGANRSAADLALLDVDYPELLFRKDTLRGSLKIRDAMTAGQPFVVQISDDEKVLWEKQLVTTGNAERTIDFDFKIDDLVAKTSLESDKLTSEVQQHTIPLKLNASIVPLQGETETANNERTMRLAAIAQSHKLLILDGRSRWETRYLRNAFERDSQWEVDTVIAGPGNDQESLPRGEAKDQFPATKEELFQYDLIFFGEISKQLFEEKEFKWLREFVALRGGGIIFIDGSRKKLQELSEEDLAPLVPVKWLEETNTTKPTRLQLTDKGATVSALKMAEEQENRRFWNELPPPHRISKVECLPGAEVLAEAMVNNATTPAIVTRNYGGGRVLFLAFDESWRWRYKTADTYHQRLWNQLARLAMPPPFSVSDDFVSIDTGKPRYGVNETIGVRVRLKDENEKPVTESTVEALVWKNDRIVSTVSLSADPDVPGIYRGDSASLPSGEYKVSVRASGFSDSAFKARGEFVIEPDDSGELQNTSTNENLLREMAAASGGTLLKEEEFSRLPEILAPISNGFVVESETVLWQSYWWFVAIVILLTIEWILRKRVGLL